MKKNQLNEEYVGPFEISRKTKSQLHLVMTLYVFIFSLINDLNLIILNNVNFSIYVPISSSLTTVYLLGPLKPSIGPKMLLLQRKGEEFNFKIKFSS